MSRALDSVIVANRGEIACRIFRTARRMGIRTIAVYSEADCNSRHVREADESICIGPPAARDSYLNIDRVVAAARQMRAAAVHPGYGFLSENPAFAQACADAGRVFVGPPATVMSAMSSKLTAKARMRAVGIPVLPGYEGEAQDLEELERQALAIGLPLMIKPAAGGGGKGMRIVRYPTELGLALAGARRLAESTFGDGKLLLERFVSTARHVEVQLFADTHGDVVHLGDRDCSTQRRHQKVVEEGPAPGLSDEIRAKLRSDAVRVAQEIGYVGAGTAEFLFDGTDCYFMEMNTRLQVEHPVTEALTGVDLVEWQFRVAAGEALPLRQDEIRLRGHAVEARVCAEDPAKHFLPSPGVLRRMVWPESRGVRVDCGFETGDVVSPHYDSLLGKVIAWAPTRAEAAAKLADALAQIQCEGVKCNHEWLSGLLRTRTFLANQHDVNSLSRLTEEALDVSAVREPVRAAE
jgi:3-methylcrotonyl-CoA carboxylase alpha subunit